MASKLPIVFLAIFSVIFTCNAATMHKRDTDLNSVISNANKVFDDLDKNVKQFAKEGIDFNSMLQQVIADAKQFEEQIQTVGKELSTRTQEAAKQQGIGA